MPFLIFRSAKKDNRRKMIRTFRILGWLEGLSFLTLLIGAVPLKYLAGHPEGVKMIGPIHGCLFLGYVVLANLLAAELNWSWKVRIHAFLAAVLPFGTFIFEKKYLASPLLPNQQGKETP
jgi:integral membrane protein